MADRHIVAMGGGGFSDGGSFLDDYVLRLTGKERPRVCFVPTASGDAATYLVQFYEAFGGGRAAPTHLPLFGDRMSPFEWLLEQDVIYVGGGSTANLLAVWRVQGIDRVLREAWDQGLLLCGPSAGSLCWFESGLTDSLGPELVPFRDGLGLLPGSHCPHYDGESDRRPAYQRFVGDGSLPAGYAADDGVGLHFVGTELAEVVTERQGAAAYHVEAVDGRVIETPLAARLLADGNALVPPRDAL